MTKTIWDFYKNQNTINKVLFALFSLIFTKSIFISPFSLVSGIWGVLLGVVLVFSIFAVCLISLYFLSHVSWTYKKTKVSPLRILLYMIPTIAVSAFLLIIFYPGIMSWDSMYIWQTAYRNEYASLHPITYVLMVRFLQSIIYSPWLVIALQFTYSAFVFAFIAYLFEGYGLNRKLCWFIAIVLAIYPVNAYQNASMLKDVPYMMSLVLMSALVLKILVEKKFRIITMVSLIIVSLITLFSRHNGLLSIPTTLFFLALYFFIKKNRAFAIKSVIVLAVVLVGFFGTNKIAISTLGERYWDRSTTSDILMMPTAQLSYTIDKNYTDLTDEQIELSYKYINVDYIFYQKKQIANWDFNNRYLETLNMDEIMADKQGFLSYYREMLNSYPMDMIKEYDQITGIIWATPNYGYSLVKNVGIPEDYPDPDINIHSQYPFPKLAEFFNRDFKVFFWLRPALWLMLSLYLLFLSKKRHGLKGLIVILPMLANASGFFMGTPAQNVRYFYCNFSCFIILLAFTLMTYDKSIASEEVNND